MSDIPLIGNPLGWAQLQLIGGWRRLVMLAGVYALGMLLVGSMIYRGSQQDITRAQFASGAMTVVTFIQLGLLFLVAPNMIRKAIHRDFTADMITSHRLSAMSGHTAVMGYLTGATAQVAAMTVVNWMACTVCAMMLGPGPSQSLAAPTVLFVVMGILALTCWTLAVLIALSTKGKAAITGLLVVLGLASNIHFIAICPGLDLLLVVIRLGNIAQVRSQPIDQVSVFVSILFQLALSLVFFLAAARKYHRDDLQAFRPILAHVLLALWSLLCAVAFGFWRATADDVWPGMDFVVDPRNQLLATLASLILMACIPVASAARGEAIWAARRAKDERFAPPPPRSYFLAPLLSTLVAIGILLLVTAPQMPVLFPVEQGGFPDRVHWIPVSFALGLLGLAGVLRYAYAVTPNGLFASVLFIVLVWAVPPFADLSLEIVNERPAGAPRSILFTASPIGVWLAVIRNLPAPIVPGIIVQGLVAAGTIMLAASAPHARARATARSARPS